MLNKFIVVFYIPIGNWSDKHFDKQKDSSHFLGMSITEYFSKLCASFYNQLAKSVHS